MMEASQINHKTRRLVTRNDPARTPLGRYSPPHQTDDPFCESSSPGQFSQASAV